MEFSIYHVAENFCESLFLRIGIFFFFYILRELILRLGQIGFSCWELIFAIFRKYPVPSSHNIFVFTYVQYTYIFSKNTMVCVPRVNNEKLRFAGLPSTYFLVNWQTAYQMARN